MALENLKDLEAELKGDGLNRVTIEEVLEALRVVYIGQEKSGTIGIPKVDVDDLYKTKLDTLVKKGLVLVTPHSGVWDYGYRCTESGNKIGSELMKRFIKENEATLRKQLALYPRKLLSWWFDAYFTKTDTGHLSSHISQLSFKYVVQELIKALDVLELTEGLRKKLVTMGVAVEAYDRKITIIPPEFADFVKEYSIPLEGEKNMYGIFKTFRDYGDRRITQRNDLLEALKKSGFTEKDLMEFLNETSELGLTTKYTDYTKKENLGKEPFAILDYNGFLGYIEEKFAVPFKESLLETVS